MLPHQSKHTKTKRGVNNYQVHNSFVLLIEEVRDSQTPSLLSDLSILQSPALLSVLTDQVFQSP